MPFNSSTSYLLIGSHSLYGVYVGGTPGELQFPPHGAKGRVRVLDQAINGTRYRFFPFDAEHLPPDCPADEFAGYEIAESDFVKGR